MPEEGRHATLLRKAQELSILCDAEVAVTAFTSDGKLHEYSTSSVEHTLSRYQNHKGGLVLANKSESERRCETASNEGDLNSRDEVLHALKGQPAALELDTLRRRGNALDGLCREELYALEQQQRLALEAVLKKKEEILVRLLHRSNQEKEILRRRCEERTKEIPYLQLFPEYSTGFSTGSEAVSDCSTEDMDIDLLRLSR